MVPTYQTHRPSLIEFCQPITNKSLIITITTTQLEFLAFFAWDLRERHDNEEGPVEALVLHEVSDEGDGLDCLSQPHLISQDTIQVVVIK